MKAAKITIEVIIPFSHGMQFSATVRGIVPCGTFLK